MIEDHSFSIYEPSSQVLELRIKQCMLRFSGHRNMERSNEELCFRFFRTQKRKLYKQMMFV